MNAPTQFPEIIQPGLKGRKQDIALYKEEIAEALRARECSPTIWSGGPGIGKTALRRAFEEELQDFWAGDEKASPPRLGKKIAFASLQVELDQLMTDQLISIRTQMAATGGYQFFLFDWAFIRWFRLAHPDADIKQRHPNMFSAKGRGPADDILSWVNDLGKEKAADMVHDSLGLVPGWNLLYKWGHTFITEAGEWLKRREHEHALKQLDNMSEEKLREYLAVLLGRGIQSGLEKQRESGPAAATLLIDGAEKLIASQEYKGASDGWLSLLKGSAPSLHLSIFSRSDRDIADLGSRLVPLEDLAESEVDDFLREGMVPPQCADEIKQFGGGSPLGMAIGFEIYQDTVAALEGSEEEKASRLHEALEESGYHRAFARMSRDLNSDAIRELLFLCCIGEITKGRIEVLGEKVFGSHTHIDFDRMFRHGILKLEHEEHENSKHSIPTLFREGLMRTDRHFSMRKRIKSQLTKAMLTSIEDRHLASKKSMPGVVADIRRAMSFADVWYEDDFELWHATMRRLIDAGYAHTVETLAFEMFKKLPQFTEGGLGLSSDMHRRELMLAEWAASVSSDANLAFGLHGRVSHRLGFRAKATELIGRCNPSDYWIAGQHALQAQDPDECEEHLERGMNVFFQHIRDELSFLEETFSTPMTGEVTYKSLLYTTAPEAFNETVVAVNSGEVGSWKEAHLAIRQLHIAVGQELGLTSPFYGAYKRSYDVLTKIRMSFVKASPALMGLGFKAAIFNSPFSSMSVLVDACDSCRSLEKDVLENEGPNEATDWLREWLAADEAGRQTVSHALACAQLEALEEDEGLAFGHRPAEYLLVLSGLARMEDYQGAQAMCAALEGGISRSGYADQPEPNRLALARLYGHYGRALHHIGAEEGAVRSKLRFAVLQALQADEQGYASVEDRMALKTWLIEDVLHPVGLTIISQTNEESGEVIYGLEPLEETYSPGSSSFR